MPSFKIVYERSRPKCRELAASNVSTNLRVLKCCREPGGVCDKRTGRPSLAKGETYEDQCSPQSPKIH